MSSGPPPMPPIGMSASSSPLPGPLLSSSSPSSSSPPGPLLSSSPWSSSSASRLPVDRREPAREVELHLDDARLVLDQLVEVEVDVDLVFLAVLEGELTLRHEGQAAHPGGQAGAVEAGRLVLVGVGALDPVLEARVDAFWRAGKRDARHLVERIVEHLRSPHQVAWLGGVADQLQAVELHGEARDGEAGHRDALVAERHALAGGVQEVELDRDAAVRSLVVRPAAVAGVAVVVARAAVRGVGRLSRLAPAVVAAGRAGEQGQDGDAVGVGPAFHPAPGTASPVPLDAWSAGACSNGFFRDLAVTVVQASNSAERRVDSQRPLGGALSPKRSIL